MLDIWSYNRKTVLGIKLKICKDDGLLKSYLIDFVEIINQKSETIKEAFIKSLRFYNIPLERVQFICSDNCNSMLKFYKLFNEQQQADVTDIVKTEETIYNEVTDRFTMNESYLHIGCMIHILQNILKNSEKNIEELSTIFDLVLIVIKNLKHGEFKHFNIFIASPIEIRWFSRVKMMETFISKWNDIKLIIYDTKLGEKVTITKKQIKLAKNYLKIIIPMVNIAKKMESENFYFVNFYTWYDDYIQFLTKQISNFSNSNPLSKLISALLKILEVKVGGFQRKKS